MNPTAEQAKALEAVEGALTSAADKMVPIYASILAANGMWMRGLWIGVVWTWVLRRNAKKVAKRRSKLEKGPAKVRPLVVKRGGRVNLGDKPN